MFISKKNICLFFWVIGFVITSVSVSVPYVYAGQGDVILQQVDKNLFPDSYELYRKLINIEPDGSKREFIFYTVRKGRAKIASLFLAPASEKGRATLRLGDNMWLYIPNVGRPIRITSLQSVTGGILIMQILCALILAWNIIVPGWKKRIGSIFWI